MSQPEPDDLFLGWNLGASEDAPARSDATRSWGWGAGRTGLTSGTRPGTRPARSGGSPRPTSTWRPTRALDRKVEPSLVKAAPDATAEPGRDASRRDHEPPVFPRIGDGIGGFRLVSELGRGAFGRVYLAEESGLGNRLVALKVSLPEGEEPRLLARLQHTHIMPIHSVHDDPESGFRLMCMPYFGGANLAQVLDATGRSWPGFARRPGGA